VGYTACLLYLRDHTVLATNDEGGK